MYKLELQWKDFSVDLTAIDAQIKAVHPTCVGNQAASTLEIWFTEQPDQAAIDDITAMWEALSETSDEALSHRTQKQVVDALQAAKESAVTKSWDTMSVIERKLIMNLTVTKDDLIAANLL